MYRDIKTSGTWEELLFSLRKIQTNLSEIVPDHPGENTKFERVMRQVKVLIMVTHRLFEQVEKSKKGLGEEPK